MPEIKSKLIEEEMKESYIDYSMSVIVGRALPDVRDGLKPVHRRILHVMNELGLLHNKPFKKSANIIGTCLAKYHPHGDMAVYDALVRMAQDFSLMYPLVDGQGNWGSIDGDSAAAYRYCITGDTLIPTNGAGIQEIKNISNKKEDKINLKIISYDGSINRASRFFNSGKHRTLKITSKNGYSLEGSYNHPILTWQIGKDFKPIIKWKLLEDLKERDIVIINRNHSLFSKDSLNLEKYYPYPEKGFKKNIKLPKVMNNDLAFLLGALTSEGSFHNNQILFGNKDKDFYNKIRSIIISQFKGIQLYERKIKDEYKELSIYEQKVVLFLKNIGLKEIKSNEKRIPFSVLMSTKDNLKNFLIALFEGNGSVISFIDKRHGGKNILINYYSKSLDLIKQLKILLLNFGVISSYPHQDKRNGCFKLTISSYDNLYKFYKEIGFFSEKKQNKLKAIKLLNSLRFSKHDFIPFLNNYLRSKYHSEFILKNNFDRYDLLNKNYSKLIKELDMKDKKFIDWILKNKFFFDCIIMVEKINEEKEVYSIRVDSNCHSFVANGFINHNTEARLSKIAEEMLADIDKDTVDFIPNFDGSTKEPVVLPSKIPNLLINGSSGIAVGMATNIPPHNIIEIVDVIVACIDNPNININELLNIVKGPDFPTGALILGREGIKSAYSTGKGLIKIRAKTRIEQKGNKQIIVVEEIPYQVNKSLLIEGIANLVRDKIIEGISDIRDESDRNGIRIIIELKKDLNPKLVLNQLYKHSQLETTFGVINIALVNNEPKQLTLKELIKHYILHRKEVVTRRSKFELKKAEERLHIVDGLIIALNNIDNVVKLIKASNDVNIAKNGLISSFKLTELQANAILDMKLQKLTSLEQTKLKTEKNELDVNIKNLREILASEAKIIQIVRNELVELKKYGSQRKTQIIEGYEAVEKEELIKEEEVAITLTHLGYIKRTPLDLYKQQKRGGKGIIAAETKDEDFIEDIFTTSTHNYILFFTNNGKVYWLKAYKIPEASRYAKGKAIVNLLNLKENERLTAAIPIKRFDDIHYLLFATKNGQLKKTNLIEYSNPRKNGIIAINLKEGDEVVKVILTNGKFNIILATKSGYAVKFDENDVRPMGRNASGVIGITLDNDKVIGMEAADEQATLLTVTENGYGKRTLISEYRLIRRGGKGVINIITNERNGNVVGIKTVRDEDELILITKNGILVRIMAKDISVIGRNTQGVRLIRLEEGDKLVNLAKIVE